MTPPLNLALAACCIVLPDAKIASPPCPLSSFQAVAVQWELMDRAECRWTFARAEDFACDLASIRQRYIDLADAPPLADAMRFPSKEACWECVQFNRAYVSSLNELELIRRADWITAARGEAEQLYRVWDLATDTQREYYYVFYRRRALQELRELIGPHAYYAGCLPAPVPVWRFQRAE